MLSSLFVSCSTVSKNDDGTVTTTYGFNLVDVQSEFGQPDSMRVLVLSGDDTLSSTRYTAQDLNGTQLFFDINVAENAQVRVSYLVYAGGVAVGAGDQTFVSGEIPAAPRPTLKPVANAGADTVLYRGAEIKFSGRVDKHAELATGYAWDYEGDGHLDREFEVNKGFVKTYSDTGTFAAVFRVTGMYGLYDVDTVQVRVQNPLPEIVSIRAPSRVTVGNEAELEINASSVFTKIVNYEWDLGGDGTWDTAGKNLDLLTVRMTTVGDWMVIVRVTDDEGRSVLDSVTLEVTERVVNFPPEINFLFQTDSVVSIKDAVGWRVDFSDGNTRADVIQFEWDLDGDGSYEKVKLAPDSMSRMYNTPGSYTVAVKITDAGGESAVAKKILRVVQGEPTVSLVASKSIAGIGESITFTTTTADSNETAKDGSIARYEWDLNGDGYFDKIASEPTASFAYPDFYASHDYMVKVRVTDDDGNTVTATQNVTVANRPPVLKAINVSQSPVSINKPSLLKVNAADFTDPDGNEIASITWSFSDGASSRTLGRNEALRLERATAGIVTVTATVEDIYGLSASKSVDVEVSEGSASVTGIGDVVTVINAQVTLNPKVIFTLGQTLASCRWNINGAGFGVASASCATTLTMPSTPNSNYTATFEASSDVFTMTTQTIHILVRNGFTDPRDGETYPVVTYNYGGADHTWMAENLNYSGHTGTGLYAAGKIYTTGWCFNVGDSDTTQHQDSSTCDNGKGRLYRWNDVMGFPELECNGTLVSPSNTECMHTIAVDHQGICPSGWHVPSDAEWTNLSTFVERKDGVYDNAGAWLKAVVEASNTSWNDANNIMNMQDPLGFSVLPTGYRRYDRRWNYLASDANFWSATENNASYAWSRTLHEFNASVSRYDYETKDTGYSLRCLQN